MSGSTDPDFAARVAAYQRKAKKGLVFQAAGTVGGKRARPLGPAWRMRPLRSLLRLCSIALIAKVAIFHTGMLLGYQAQSTLIFEGMGLQQQAAKVLFYPDPISVEFSRLMTVVQLHFAVELRKVL